MSRLSSHPGTVLQCYNKLVPEWLEPFWHGQLHYLSARMAGAILQLAVPEWLEPFCMALEYCNWPCHAEWLEPFWHSSIATGRALMAPAILALK